MIEFKSDRIKKEFYFDIHPRLRGMMLELERHATINAETLESPKLYISCAKRTTQENFQIYGDHRPSAHCTRPCRAVDIVINTQGHPNYIGDRAAAALQNHIEKWFPRYDGYKAVIRHGKAGHSDHLHISVQP